MKILVNGIDKGEFSLPNFAIHGGRCKAFDSDEVVVILRRLKMSVDDVGTRVSAAFRTIQSRCAVTPTCNRYFASLRRKLTLAQVLEDGPISIHCLLPIDGRSTWEQLPSAITADRDIAISPVVFGDKPDELTKTLIHELAHIAGATTNKGDKNALEAELSLPPCGFPDYDKSAKG